MATVAGGNNTNATAAAAKAASTKTSALGQEQFLTLLVAQLQNQDPLNPQDSADFAAQLAPEDIRWSVESAASSRKSRTSTSSRPSGVNAIASPLADRKLAKKLYKLARKAAKQFLWVAFALWTGFTFVGYFTPIRQLWAEAFTLDFGPWEWFWVLFYGFATYGNAGFMREQVCKYMCPYARFQSAMFDRDTLIITYDSQRGEPRGPRGRKGEDAAAQGACVDCGLCVQVCPTGIDIRKGLQYECIGCAACIDACDSVMDRVGYPRGLIRYTTEAAVQGGKTHVLRPRIVIYGLLLLSLLAALGTAVALRTPLTAELIADRGRLYREVGDDDIENVYTLKVVNKSTAPERYRAAISGLPGAVLETDPAEFTLPPGGVAVVPTRIRVPEDALEHRVSRLTLTVTAASGAAIAQDVRFLGPSHD